MDSYRDTSVRRALQCHHGAYRLHGHHVCFSLCSVVRMVLCPFIHRSIIKLMDITLRYVTVYER